MEVTGAGSYVQEAHSNVDIWILFWEEMSDRMTDSEQLCCCDLTLFGLPKIMCNFLSDLSNDFQISKLHRFSVTSTAGGLMNTGFGPRHGLRTTCFFFLKQWTITKTNKRKKQLTDQATVINTLVNTLMLHREKKKKKETKERSCVQHTHTRTHTNIFKYSSVIFNSSYIQEWSETDAIKKNKTPHLAWTDP